MHGILAVVITICAPAFAGADVIAYTAFWGGDVFSGTRTDTVVVDQFDPAYGTLTDVRAYLYGGGHEVVQLTGNPLDNAAMVLAANSPRHAEEAEQPLFCASLFLVAGFPNDGRHHALVLATREATLGRSAAMNKSSLTVRPKGLA